MMNVTVKQIAGAQSFNWESIADATVAQAVDNPENIVLKVTNGVALRLTTVQMGAKGTTQNPGHLSRWYKCQMSMEVTPEVSTTKQSTES